MERKCKSANLLKVVCTYFLYEKLGRVKNEARFYSREEILKNHFRKTKKCIIHL